MRRLLSLLLGPLAVGLSALVLVAGPAAAASPHFISEGTASITSSGAYLVSNFKEAGLGNTATAEPITLSASATGRPPAPSRSGHLRRAPSPRRAARRRPSFWSSCRTRTSY